MDETRFAIGAIAPWFGSKRTLAARIIEEMGAHRAYWEPFCGSLSVLLAKPKVSMETVNDLNADLINLVRTMMDEVHGPRLYRRLRRAVMSDELFLESARVIRDGSDEPTPERAFHYFVYSWMGRNGDSGTTKRGWSFCKRYTKNGGHSATRFAGVVDSIPAFRRRLRNVTVLQTDAFDLLDRIEDAPGVVIYADPPYLTKNGKYIHDFEPTDHERLADALSRFKRTRVIVSYYYDPRLERMYPGWTLRRLKVTKAMANLRNRDGKGATSAPEVLLINGRSYCETNLLLE